MKKENKKDYNKIARSLCADYIAKYMRITKKYALAQHVPKKIKKNTIWYMVASGELDKSEIEKIYPYSQYSELM